MLRTAAARLAAAAAEQQASCAAAAAAAVASTSSSRGYASLPDDYSTLVIQNPAKDMVGHVSTPPSEIGYCAGVPRETFARKARVFSPARTAGQQGLANTAFNARGRPWRVSFETQAKWVNPLMGWTSTADPLENVARAALQFHTKEEAVAFCVKHGWEPVVDEPKQRRATRQRRYAAYGDNFSTKRAGVPDLSTLPSNRGGGGGSKQ